MSEVDDLKAGMFSIQFGGDRMDELAALHEERAHRADDILWPENLETEFDMTSVESISLIGRHLCSGVIQWMHTLEDHFGIPPHVAMNMFCTNVQMMYDALPDEKVIN